MELQFNHPDLRTRSERNWAYLIVRSQKKMRCWYRIWIYLTLIFVLKIWKPYCFSKILKISMLICGIPHRNFGTISNI